MKFTKVKLKKIYNMLTLAWTSSKLFYRNRLSITLIFYILKLSKIEKEKNQRKLSISEYTFEINIILSTHQICEVKYQANLFLYLIQSKSWWSHCIAEWVIFSQKASHLSFKQVAWWEFLWKDFPDYECEHEQVARHKRT